MCVAEVMFAKQRIVANDRGAWGCTVRCRYNADKFLENTHKRHPIARLLGWGMGVFCGFTLWVILCFGNCSDMCNVMSYWAALYRRLTLHESVFCDAWYAVVIRNRIPGIWKYKQMPPVLMYVTGSCGTGDILLSGNCVILCLFSRRFILIEFRASPVANFIANYFVFVILMQFIFRFQPLVIMFTSSCTWIDLVVS